MWYMRNTELWTLLSITDYIERKRVKYGSEVCIDYCNFGGINCAAHSPSDYMLGSV